jgi:predicted CopG family antitoxin
MVKTIHIHLDDEEHKKLKEKKGNMSWHDYICKEID